MSSRLELGPADLDRLEDALEDLERELDPDADDPVAQRLVEYRALLQLSREAMPLEEVPAGVLDGVLAQARQAAAAGAVAATPAPSFWARWRLSVWVPSLAFAGSAALLLLVLVPKQGDEPVAVAQADRDVAKQEAEGSATPSAASPVEQAAGADQRLAFADPAAEAVLDADAEEPARGDGLSIGERAPDPAPPGAIDEEPSADEPKGKKADRKAAGSTAPSSSGAGGASPPQTKLPSAPGPSKAKPSPKPEPTVDPAKEDEKQANEEAELWSEIARADSDRRGGGCGLAKMRYDKLRKTDDSRVRARALAGLGLCEAAADSMSTAKKLFAQARAADPGVSGFIDTELARLESARSNTSDQANQAAD